MPVPSFGHHAEEAGKIIEVSGLFGARNALI
jgi:hypothetical protein